MPGYTITIISGALIHNGSGHFISFKSKLKGFAHCDPRKFRRAERENVRDQVAMRDVTQLTIRETNRSFALLSHVAVASYECLEGCSAQPTHEHHLTSLNHYFYPYCKVCLHDRAKLLVHCNRAVHKVQGKVSVKNGLVTCQRSITYEGSTVVKKGHRFPLLVKGQIVTLADWMTLYPGLKERYIGLILLDGLRNQAGLQLFLDCLKFHSFVFSMKQSQNYDECNVELVFEPSQSSGTLKATRQILSGEELVLYNGCYNLLDEFVAIAFNQMLVDAANRKH
jgi:hypothetical protein